MDPIDPLCLDNQLDPYNQLDRPDEDWESSVGAVVGKDHIQGKVPQADEGLVVDNTG